MLDLEKIEAAISQIGAEKKISKEDLIEIIEAAIATAYKKDYGNRDEDIKVTINLSEKKLEITQYKTLVEEVENKHIEMTREELRNEIGDDADLFEIGEEIEFDLSDTLNSKESEFGRIASGAARQVIIQKLQDNEKKKIYDIFKDKAGTIVNLKVDLADRNKVYLEYNGNSILFPKREQVSRDKYVPGQRMFFYIDKVESEEEGGSPELLITRKSKELVRLLFEMNSPELGDGTIEIVDLVRIPGSRTKIVVRSNNYDIDAAGSLIGPKGSRVKSVVDELFGERIDLINMSDDPAELIKNALSPANVNRVEIDEDENRANCYLNADEKARAVGKGGQNVTLVHRLTNYDIDIIVE